MSHDSKDSKREPPRKRRRLNDKTRSPGGQASQIAFLHIFLQRGLNLLILEFFDLSDRFAVRRLSVACNKIDPNPDPQFPARFRQWQRILDRIAVRALLTNKQFSFVRRITAACEDSTTTSSFTSSMCPTEQLLEAYSRGYYYVAKAKSESDFIRKSQPNCALYPCTHCSKLKSDDKRGVLRITVPLVPYPDNLIQRIQFDLANAWLCQSCLNRPMFQIKTANVGEQKYLWNHPKIKRCVIKTTVYVRKRDLPSIKKLNAWIKEFEATYY